MIVHNDIDSSNLLPYIYLVESHSITMCCMIKQQFVTIVKPQYYKHQQFTMQFYSNKTHN